MSIAPILMKHTLNCFYQYIDLEKGIPVGVYTSDALMMTYEL